ncbi:hypothetical protein HYH03_015666 [Edaphochlamys debaryana]|uniref:Protein kinase domain-containing protein n=1 Tax=Edaphochlamys debaryana TaxID=47281 RepID=A0A835XMQ4_9CHLO|nr:hypothetical protein HYH03_015666 [Edaphochlamys debaryana]|eukprot:KAG2485603.1 hypothetical protein HYH03_015666 [Edaphochlamys debaryana]
MAGFRKRDNMISRPGLDLLLPSPPGTVGAMVLVNTSMAISNLCFPPKIMGQNFARVARPPTVPGEQRFQVDVPQPGCLDAAAAGANLTARCWPQVQRLEDFALTGADADAADKPQPNNYVIQLNNCVSACRQSLTQECVDQLGPIGCQRLAQNASQALPPLVPGEGDAATDPAPAGVSPAPDASVVVPGQGSPGAGGGSSGPPVGPIVAGCVVGGVLAALVVAGFLLWRRRRQSRCPPSFSAAWVPDDDKLEGGVLEGGGLACGTSSSRDASHPTASLSPAASRREPVTVVVTTQTPARPCTLTELQVVSSCDEGSQPTVTDGGSQCTGSTCEPAEAPAAVVLTGRVLGKGSYGRVHEGVYLGQRVAVKQFAHGTVAEAPLPESVMRSCVQELEILARCDHPNVVRLLAACVTGPRPVIVMELCDVSLAQLLYNRSDGALLPMPLVLHIAAEVAKGLEYLHPTIVHRDLKPANVLINNITSPLPEVKLADFGLSRIWDTVQPTKTPEAGTPPYLAPECFDARNHVVTNKADIYSWGVCVWEMLAGSKPWAGVAPIAIATQVTLKNTRLPVPPSGDADPTRWPKRLRLLLWNAWDKDPGRRPAAAEIAKELLLLREMERQQGSAEAAARDEARTSANV